MRELDRLKCIQGLIDGQLRQNAVATRLGLTTRSGFAGIGAFLIPRPGLRGIRLKFESGTRHTGFVEMTQCERRDRHPVPPGFLVK